MRAVILADPLDNQHAGIHYYTRELVSHVGRLDEHGNFFIPRQREDDLFPTERQIIVKNYRFPGYAALRMFWIIPRKIRKLKADVVIEPAHFGPFNLPERMKRVTVIHDLTPIIMPQWHRFHSQFLQRIFLKGILKRARLIITNSLNTSRDLFAYYAGAETKTKHIYLGRDDKMSPDNNTSGVHEHTNGKPYFLFTGTIEPRKNLECLLEAFRIYKKENDSEQMLVIVGQKGWKSSAFYKQLSVHPNKSDIILTGYIKREMMAAFYTQADAFVLPSFYEGFGLPVVEAMSCGAPCLLSENSSLPEVGGDAALYFKPEAPQELAALLQKIKNEEALRREMSEKSLSQASKFSWNNHARVFMDEIEKLQG
jgi:glycosyltransferase involved in cell wall biosynthesis